MLKQSREEILRVFQEWVDNHAPKNFDINSKKNGLLLTNYILETHDVVSITYLNEAYAALASALDHLPEAKPKTQAELASEFDAKERARIKREAAENLAGTKKFDNLNLPKAS